MNKKVLLSTDIGSDIDDALALQVMLNSGIVPRGVYTVNGDVKSRAYIAKHMINLSGGKTKVGMGESEPQRGGIPPYTFYEECHVDDCFIDEEKSKSNKDLVYNSPKEVGISEKGLEEMARMLAESPSTIFSIGPLTNIAALLEKYPHLSNRIEQLYVMGCRFADNSAHEHNIRFDVPAARKVFDSNLPIVVVPGDLCSTYRMPASEIEKMSSPIGKYVQKMAKGFMATKTAHQFVVSRLQELIKNEAKIDPAYANSELDKKRLLKNFEMPQRLSVNLGDAYFASLDPQEYFKQYWELINHLRNPEFNYSRAHIITSILEGAIPKDISVSDVYVPYCFLHPEKIKTEKANVSIDIFGHSTKTAGNNHTVVTNLDFNDFKEFLLRNLK